MAGPPDKGTCQDALQKRHAKAEDSLPGYRIYSWSERRSYCVAPAHLSFRPHQLRGPYSPSPPHPDKRTRLLFEGLRNNGRFVLTGIINDLDDERRAEEARAAKALEAEHAALGRKKRANSAGARFALAYNSEKPPLLTKPASPEQQTHPGLCPGAEKGIVTQEQIETDQTRQRAPSFDPEFDQDRGIFNDPLAEFGGADPFADFDGDYTHLYAEIDYGEERGNLSGSDRDDDTSSEEEKDRGPEEDLKSEDEFAGTDPFTDFDGDYTHLNPLFDFEAEQTDSSDSGEISLFELELGRASLPEQSDSLSIVLTYDEELGYDIDNYSDDEMDSIDEILAAAPSNEFTHEGEEEDEDMGDDVDLDYEDADDLDEDDEHDMDAMPSVPFNPIAMGLKEIGGLAHFRVSSYKPGNGVDELKNDDTDRFWQCVLKNGVPDTFVTKAPATFHLLTYVPHRSDGVQPHRLTIAFVKEVEIRALRFFVDYIQDESYTPTKIVWKAGTSENNLFKFAESELVNPSGWVDVPITGAGGGEDGNSLMAWVVRMEVVENHQNGKDTHIRGIKIYGFDDQLRAAGPTTGGTAKEGAEGDVGFKMDETKNAEENEKALMAHLRNKDFERSMGVGDPSGTASSLDFIEDPVLR